MREVTLPPIREEARRALGLFAFFVGVAVLAFAITGVVLTHAGAVFAGTPPESGQMVATALWYGGWTALFVVPFAGIGLARELSRYAAIRRSLGGSAWLDAAGVLLSQDGRTRIPVRGAL